MPEDECWKNSPWPRRLHRLQRRLHLLLDHVFAERCAACRTHPTPKLLCATCTPAEEPMVRWIQVAQHRIPAYAPYRYSGTVRDALHRFKFRSHPELARRMAESILAALPNNLCPQAALWVSVPLAAPDLAKRGYNQAALLASHLASATQSEHAPRLLRRRCGSLQQSRLGRAERVANLRTTFYAAPGVNHAIQHKPVILVDDVLTTGATATACCGALLDQGYPVAAIVTFAHVTLDPLTAPQDGGSSR